MNERLSAIETVYLALEERRSPIHVGSVAIFEGGPLLDRHGALRLADLRARIASRLHQLPRLRQRPQRVPLDIGRPIWVDDPTFDIANHVEVFALPRPGDDDALARLTSDLLNRPLRTDRPMWSLGFVSGLPGGRIALVERVQHAMVDGLSGVEMATVLLDVDRDPTPSSPTPWAASPCPSPVRLVTDALTDHVVRTGRLVGRAVDPLIHPSTGRAIEFRRAVGGAGSRGVLAPRSSLNRPTGPRRTLAFVRQQLVAVKQAGRRQGATVNDVLLSAVAGGLRSLLLARGEPLPHDRTVKVMVPMSLRGDATRRALGNQVGALMLPLPLGIGDPRARLRAVATTSAAMKEHREVATSEWELAAADLVPGPLVAPLGCGLLAHQPLVNLVVTNVPGPSFPLYAMGAEMLEAFPVVPLAGNLTLGVAALSYNGALNLGVTADADACPDAEAFVAGIERSFAQLVERAA
jgi:WS/DGAT/MGAT family acyltransferase